MNGLFFSLTPQLINTLDLDIMPDAERNFLPRHSPPELTAKEVVCPTDEPNFNER